MSDTEFATLPPATAESVRKHLRTTLRRDLIGPVPDDSDIARELLGERPGRWYLTGYLVPAPDVAETEADTDEELGDPAEATDPQPGGGRAEDDGEADPGATRRIMQPSSLGLTVQVPIAARHLIVTLCWATTPRSRR